MRIRTLKHLEHFSPYFLALAVSYFSLKLHAVITLAILHFIHLTRLMTLD